MKKNKTSKADLIRKEALEHGHCHSNKWFRVNLEQKYGLRFTSQEIQVVLGRSSDRRISDLQSVHDTARRFLLACQNDLIMAKRILSSYDWSPVL